MALLSVGAVVGGKFIYLLDLMNLENAYTNSLLGRLINIVTVSGVVFGIFRVAGPKARFFLSRMFFLTPIVRSRTLSLSPLVSRSLRLDQGWLEPSCIFKDSLYFSRSTLSSFFSWPNVNLRLIRSLFLLIILLTFAFTFNF